MSPKKAVRGDENVAASLEGISDETLYRALFEDAPDCIHLIDLNGRVRRLNRSGLRMIGLERAADVEGTRFLDYVAEEDRDRVTADLKRAFAGEACSIEFTAKTGKGPRTYVKNLAPLRDGDGQVAGLVAVTHDVTETRRMEAVERAANSRFRSMVENLPAGAVYRDGDSLFMNQAIENITGYPASDIATVDRWFELLHGDEAPLVKGLYDSDRKAGFPEPRRVSLRRNDGEERVVRFEAYRDDGAEIWLLHDVTEEHRAHVRHAELAAIVESSEDAIFRTSFDSVIETWNSGAQETYGYSAAEVIGKHVSILLPGGAKGEVDLLRSRIRNGERIERFETLRRRKDGRDIHVSLAISPVLDEGGRVVGAAAVARDVTERKRKDDALRASEERLRELTSRLLTVQEEERRHIAQELHDDVGQKLALLRMSVDRLTASERSSLRGEEDEKEAETLRGLVEDLANRVRGLSHRLHPSAVEHLGLIVALRKECETFAQMSGRTVTLRMDENVPRRPPLGVAMCLYRVAQEAVGNAVRHSGSDRIEVSLERVDGGIRLTVKDWGDGFETDEGRSDWGLGLVSMEERARPVNGRFEIDSEIGVGTSVRCWTPLSEEADLE